MAVPILNLKTMSGVGAEAATDAGDRAIEAGEDGADANDRAGADDDAEHREERAQLVLANGVERQPMPAESSVDASFFRPQRFDGSSLAARCAG